MSRPRLPQGQGLAILRMSALSHSRLHVWQARSCKRRRKPSYHWNIGSSHEQKHAKAARVAGNGQRASPCGALIGPAKTRVPGRHPRHADNHCQSCQNRAEVMARCDPPPALSELKKGAEDRALFPKRYARISAWRTGSFCGLSPCRTSCVPPHGCRGSGSLRLSTQGAGRVRKVAAPWTRRASQHRLAPKDRHP